MKNMEILGIQQPSRYLSSKRSAMVQLKILRKQLFF